MKSSTKHASINYDLLVCSTIQAHNSNDNSILYIKNLVHDTTNFIPVPLKCLSLTDFSGCRSKSVNDRLLKANFNNINKFGTRHNKLYIYRYQ